MDEAEEGQRELGFYTQALAAVKSAQARASTSPPPLTSPHRRPSHALTRRTRPHLHAPARTSPHPSSRRRQA